MNSRLTLNLGLRYELFMPVTEGKNEMATFDFSTGTLIVPSGQNAPLTPTIASFLPIQRNASAGLISPDYTRLRSPAGCRLSRSRQAGTARRLRNFLRRAGERSLFVSQPGL